MAVQDGNTYTQAECDTYLAEIETYQLTHDWMAGKTATYVMRQYDWDGSALGNEAAIADAYTGDGAHGYYPEWRTANPSFTEIGSDQNSHSWGQWDYFTNRRSDWDTEVSTLGTDLGQMRNHHAEMLATIPE